MPTRRNVAAPNLYVAPKDYVQSYQEQLNTILRLFFNSTANAINSPIPFGSFYTLGTFTNLTTANQEKLVPFKVTTASFSTKIGTDPTRIYVAETGVYNVQFSAQCNLSTGSNKEIYFWLKQNGLPIPATTGKVALSASAPIMAAWNWILVLQEGDYIELAWSSSDTHAELLEETNLTNPVRPYLPAVILTVVWTSSYNKSAGIS